MALFIRRRPPERCNSTEVEVAAFLADLEDDWLVRWGFVYHDPWGEPREGDFLVVSPKGGLLVLEVKAGTLRLDPYTGRWNTATGDDPWFQLNEQWDAVLAQVLRHSGSRQTPFVSRALACPHLTLGPNVADHHGIPRTHIFDRRDLREFARSWDAHMRGCHARFHGWDREVIEAAFGPEGSPVAVKVFVDDLDRMLARHTESAFALLDSLEENTRFLFSGGAGTGKTWLALELAKRWAVQQGLDVLVLGYNLAFTRELKALLQKMKAAGNLPRGSITILPWEELARHHFARAGMAFDPPADAANRTRFFEKEVPCLLQQLLEDGEVPASFDALVVDEAQDHDTGGGDVAEPRPSWWNFYFGVLRRGAAAPVAVFMDEAQRPSFRSGSFDVADLLRAWKAEPVRIRLGASLRYTRPIHAYLKGLEAPELVALRLGLGSTPPHGLGPDVEVVDAPAASVPDAVAKMVSGWIQQGWARPEQILVLSRRGSLAGSALAQSASLAGHPLQDDFHPLRGHVGFGSVNKAKGLDRLAVVVVDFPPWKSMPPEERVPFFMGASRARQLLAVVGTV